MTKPHVIVLSITHQGLTKQQARLGGWKIKPRTPKNSPSNTSAAAVILIIDEKQVTVTKRSTGEILSEHQINPDKKYWPRNQKSPT